jgi:hypothetical protein
VLLLRRLALLLTIPLLAAVSACGSSASGAGADPAAAVPRGVPFYAEVVLRPDGGARDDALAAAGTLLRTSDPEAKIRSLLQQAFASGGDKVDFAKDVEPWLGDRAGLWVTVPARSGAEPGVAAVVAVSDADLARSKLDELAKRNGEKLTARTSGAHEYEATADGSAVAVEGDYALIGTEAEVKRGLATLDGDGLAQDDAYRKAIAPLDADRLAHYYLDTTSLVNAALRADPSASAQLGPFAGMLTGQLGAPSAGSFSAGGERLVVESFGRAGGLASKLGGLTGLASSGLLKALPGDAWGALAVPKLGASLRTVFDQLAGAIGGAAVVNELRTRYGIDLEQDVFSWMGDTGLFVRGTSVDAVDGALVVQATDEARAATSFGKIVGLLRTQGGLDPQPVKVDGAQTAFSVMPPGAPKPLVLARGKGRVVAAYGTAAAAAGLGSARTLGSSEALAHAGAALGGGIEPAMFVAIAPVLALAESAGAGTDAGYAKAKPYLEALDVVSTGSKRDGDTLRSRFAVGLR